MLFKDISYLELWRPLCSVEQNQFFNCTRAHFENNICEIIFEFGPVDQDVYFVSIALVDIFFSGVKPFVQCW